MMKKEHNATPEASPLSNCELTIEDLDFVGGELVDEELEVVVGGFGASVNLNVLSFAYTPININV
ncbi:hypothetical protein [Nostoc sp.]|uniref:hypothetical protein n=1 Tax=Nostoc sp. TaxID=1180 RepID=UPI002FFA4FB1